MEYPEHERLKEVEEEFRSIGEFLEWLEGRNIELGQMGKGDRGIIELLPIQKTKEALVAEYFNIDKEALEKEKVQMFEALKDMNKTQEGAERAK